MGTLILLLLLAAAAPAQSPAARPVAPRPPAVVSPEVLPDHRVVFRLRAPQAKEVTITGDFWLEQGRREKLVKDDQGMWSLTTEPLTSDLYSYNFTLDGVSIPDPANGLTKPGAASTQSAFWVPGEQAALLEAGPTPHGEVRIVSYEASVVGKVRRMHIYFPPGYDTGQTRYPVVYLCHGGGDDDSTWISVGRANFMLDNLVAQGKAKPMIVVMPSLWVLDTPVPAERRDENETLFRKSLVEDIIPYVETHYRVAAGPANRAIAGLGIGRPWLPNTYWPMLDKFNYVGHASGGVDEGRIEQFYEKQYPGVLDNPANSKRVKFFLGDGINDSSIASAKYTAEELKKRGYNTTLFLTDGTHGWPAFRRHFAGFVQQVAFR